METQHCLCSKRHFEQITAFCNKCKQFVCEECIIFKHYEPKHLPHVQNLNEIFTIRIGEYNGLRAKLELLMKSHAQMIKELENINIKKAIEKKISKTYDEIVRQVYLHKEKVLKMIFRNPQVKECMLKGVTRKKDTVNLSGISEAGSRNSGGIAELLGDVKSIIQRLKNSLFSEKFMRSYSLVEEQFRNQIKTRFDKICEDTNNLEQQFEFGFEFLPERIEEMIKFSFQKNKTVTVKELIKDAQEEEEEEKDEQSFSDEVEEEDEKQEKEKEKEKTHQKEPPKEMQKYSSKKALNNSHIQKQQLMKAMQKSKSKNEIPKLPIQKTRNNNSRTMTLPQSKTPIKNENISTKLKGKVQIKAKPKEKIENHHSISKKKEKYPNLMSNEKVCGFTEDFSEINIFHYHESKYFTIPTHRQNITDISIIITGKEIHFCGGFDVQTFQAITETYKLTKDYKHVYKVADMNIPKYENTLTYKYFSKKEIELQKEPNSNVKINPKN